MNKAIHFQDAQRLPGVILGGIHVNKWLDQKAIIIVGKFQRHFPGFSPCILTKGRERKLLSASYMISIELSTYIN